MADQAPKLLPCPFCGSDEITVQRKKGFTNKTPRTMWMNETVLCKVCGITTAIFHRKKMAIEAWNTRPTPSNREPG